MTGPEARVTVVIPTLGRPCLRAAIDSVVEQQVEVELVVVNDSGSPLDLALLAGCPGVHVVNTPGRRGAAAARNLGLARVTTQFFAFLDDDDQWLPGHLAQALDALDADPGADLYFCRGEVVGPTGSRTVPVEALGTRSLRHYLAGDDQWRSRNRRVLTPTIVARRGLASHQMDEDLTSGEDTWWLLTAEAAGARAIQGLHLGVRVDADHPRDELRSTQRDHLAWADRLDSARPGAGNAYLAGFRGRAAARAGDPATVLLCLRQLARRPGGLRWLPLGAAELALGCGVALARQVHKPAKTGSRGRR